MKVKYWNNHSLGQNEWCVFDYFKEKISTLIKKQEFIIFKNPSYTCKFDD